MNLSQDTRVAWLPLAQCHWKDGVKSKADMKKRMTMWPTSTRVNKPENDDPSLLDRTGDVLDVWAPLKCEGRA